MKVLVEFVILSEASELFNKAEAFIKAIPNCKVCYLRKGEYKKYENGKQSILPAKNSQLTIASEDSDYNNTIIRMFTVYDSLLEFFSHIDHDTFLTVDFFSNDMFSLEFGVEVLGLLKKYNFSLPVSCYREKL